MRRIICFVLLLLLLPTTFMTAHASYFTDVSRTDSDTAEYFNAIMWMTDNEYMSGTSSTAFSPNQAMTRAMFVTVLYAYSGCPDINENLTNPFDDVKESKYYYKAVLWAYYNNVVSGMSQTTFGPNQSVTYAQAITVLRSYAEYYKGYTLYFYETPSQIPGYNNPESNPSHFPGYAKEPVRWAVSNGLIEVNNAGADAFIAKIRSNVPRKDIARIINHFHTNVEGLIIGKNHYSFFNTYSNTANSPQSPNYMSSAYNRTLISNLHFNRILGKCSTSGQDKINNDYSTTDSWKGACHGMCLSMIADMTGLCNFDAMYTNLESSMYDIPLPVNCYTYPNITTSSRNGTAMSWSESAIHYFHLIQCDYNNLYNEYGEMITTAYDTYGGIVKFGHIPGTNTNGILGHSAFRDKANHCSLMLLNLKLYSDTEYIYHTVIMLGPPKKLSDGTRKYIIYDPQITYGPGNSVQQTPSYLIVPATVNSMSDFSLDSAPGLQIREIRYIGDLSFFDRYDIDGAFNTTP